MNMDTMNQYGKFRATSHRAALFALILTTMIGAPTVFSLPFGHMGLANHRSTGYIGPSIGMSPVESGPATWVGLRGGWEFDHAVAVGVTGNWLLSNIEEETGNSANLGYGGIEFRTFLLSQAPVSLAFDLTIGAGSVGSGVHFMGGGHHDSDEESDGFFVVEPELQLVFRANRFVRLELGAGYFITSGVDVPGINDGDLSGPKATLSMSFGDWL